MAAESTNDIIKEFQTRVRLLMYEYEKVRSRCDKLSQEVEQKNQEINTLHGEVERLEQSYQTLKMSKIIEINDGDATKSKQRLDALVRQVDKCIALLNV